MRHQYNQNQAFGLVLRTLRERCKKSQETLAFDTGLSRNFISLLETGQSSPTLDTIQSLLPALNISLVELAQLIEQQQSDSGA